MTAKLQDPLRYTLVLAILLAWSCRTPPSEASEVGATLARQHCGSCHQFPSPELLDRSSWEKFILPRMGVMMGALAPDAIPEGYVEANFLPEIYEQGGVFQENSPLSEEDWEAIMTYYLEQAPKNLPGSGLDSLPRTLTRFAPVIPAFKLSPPATTLVQFQGNRLFIADANTQSLFHLDERLQIQQQAKLGEGIVKLLDTPAGYMATVMGSFSPTDQALGKLINLPKESGLGVGTILDGLRRPTDVAFADLNQDGALDIVTCEFGKWMGGLSWWENKGQGNFERHWLRQLPGAMQVYVKDVNQDTLPDIVALFGQGTEGIVAFVNQGKGQFQTQNWLSFPPSYGSSSFRLFDANADGKLDILYTAGDNADYVSPVKPYQGIYLFTQEAQNSFKQVFFYAFPGAYDAIPADFDGDGDLDIAAISFFPDFSQQPARSFVYLEGESQRGETSFRTYVLPEADIGRWMVMDSGDLDQDGDLDLVLGSFTFETTPDRGWVRRWSEKGIPFLFLENQTR